MRSLLDVNVLIALLDADHNSHARALAWLKAHAASGWASCPLTQNGCVRVVSLLDPSIVDASRIHGPRQVIDVYLPALAVRHGGRLVTFDASIAAAAVQGAEGSHLVVL